MTQHLANLLVSIKIGENTCLECEWYVVNLICDATIGVAVQYLYLHLAEALVKGTKSEFISGDYGENSKFKCFVFQSFFWVIVVLFAKFSNVGLLFVFYNFFERLGIFILSPFNASNKLKLIFVMIIFPTFFLTLQLWLTDNIIKKPQIQQEKENLQLNIDKSTNSHIDIKETSDNDMKKNNFISKA